MVDWNEVLKQVSTEVLRIMIPVLVVLVLKWIVEIYKRIREKHPEIAELISYAAQLGYAAAEDFFRNYRAADGTDKMNYAVLRAGNYLSELGIHVDEEVLKDAITRYGVESYKFSWAKPTFDLSGIISGQQKEEDDHESGTADHLRDGTVHNDHYGDHYESSERTDRPDQTAAKDQDGK